MCDQNNDVSVELAKNDLRPYAEELAARLHVPVIEDVVDEGGRRDHAHIHETRAQNPAEF